ncbi:MAG: NADH:ubiquinone reductase (Na(+)-transporting) subunit B [Candidatus Marinimicrobia bacterium]|jgi:Na+-transporting NADH:ubiquinone oxidoreductase subunit B|nr:NADH:ubiquinone reductase (Na(+)-transporting) subunit B [Gammaproteobacteria bacterium]MBL6911603.1 NADH:ubiquinone reductase (Na(+)-transporting) subunit B [Candidatus Neomarinimicrobiota bacterium]MBT3727659.1 NADH:ubiquinone reductase (Na(+)-transporting) subunit B [Candidatus Neomarinimicrobiota bacterium]MBT3944716.1 NADH:ubiquinone reductase (Na(+)-transporting) subunit B [Candidatus Neomarinimicrobiota bacterium]MBT4111817.1 NADH:ubiquinone reductase (Na(+)-transporting) subunit B [C
MNFLKKILAKSGKLFEEGKPLSFAYPLWEATDTILFSTDSQNKSGPHIRDNMDIKRTMFFVVIALIPCYLFGAYNIGYLYSAAMGVSSSVMSNFILGMTYVLPILIVTFIAGAICEITFAVIRKHEINEGFLVSCALIPLTMPPDIPLWQLFIGTSFGIIIGKEIFGGVGTNVFNPALTARAFMYFAFPTKISGEKVWAVGPDGYTGATALSIPANPSEYDTATNLFNQATQFDFSTLNLFWGLIPGSIGETNKLLILLGGIFLIYCGIASWRIMMASVLGLVFTAGLFNLLAEYSTNAMLTITPLQHILIGSFLFGTVFMASEPVTSTHTNKGRWIYGFMIGVLTVIIRSVNPAYPEGVMLAILIMNMFAPLIDYYIVKSNINMRMSRNA